MMENEQLEVIESEGDGWIRVGADCFYCYLRQGGYVFVIVWLFVRLSVC